MTGGRLGPARACCSSLLGGLDPARSAATWPRCSAAARRPGDRVFLPSSGSIYRLGRVDPEREQRWTVYAFSVLAFSVVGDAPALRDAAAADRRCR